MTELNGSTEESTDRPDDLAVIEMIVRYADGTISEEALEELTRLIENDARASQLFGEVYLHASAAADEARSSLLTRAPRKPALFEWNTGRAVIATILTVLLGLAIRWFWSDGPVDDLSDSNVAQLVSLQGSAERLLPDGSRVPLTIENRSVNADDQVITHGETSVAVLERKDGSRFSVLGQGQILLANVNDNEVKLIDGLLVVSAKPQARNNPLRITMERARLDVLGTSFAVERRGSQTDVDVLTGAVRLTDLQSETTREILKGNRGTRSSDGDVVVAAAPLISDTFHEDFSQGIPHEGYGVPVTEGLPAGSSGGVRPVFNDRYEPGHFHVSLHSAGMDGLFRITPDSHIEVVCLFGHLEWVNLFLGVMDLDPTSPKHTLYKFNGLERAVAVQNVWKRVLIPISVLTSESVFGSGDFDGPPPDVDGVPISILISWPKTDHGGEELLDRELIIDSIRVLKSGPGEITVESVE